MAEYIEREALLEDIQAAVENGGMGSMVAGALKRYVTRVPAADVAPVQKWIPVTERLPEEEGLYLVAVVNDHERRYSKTAWYHGHGNWFLHQKVTNWMPLPEPPKEESDG